MRRYREICIISVLIGAILISSSALADVVPSFILGVLPIHSARVLAERYEPLRHHLEKSLGKTVRVESATNFRHFQERTLHGDFDLTITPAHFARLAQKDAGFQPLAQFEPDHDALLIYSADHPLAKITELKGKKLAVIDRLAITVTATLQYLDTQGLEADHDFQVVEHRTHASAAYALVRGLSAAAVTTSQGLLQMPEEVRRKLIIQKHIADIPAFVFIARPAMDKEQSERLKNSLLTFARRRDGIRFMANIGYKALNPASETAMKRADVLLKDTRKALE